MQITLNGHTKIIDQQLTVSGLFEQLGIRSDQAVLELNDAVLSPELYDSTDLKAGDSIELIQFVGGG